MTSFPKRSLSTLAAACALAVLLPAQQDAPASQQEDAKALAVEVDDAAKEKLVIAVKLTMTEKSKTQVVGADELAGQDPATHRDSRPAKEVGIEDSMVEKLKLIALLAAANATTTRIAALSMLPLLDDALVVDIRFTTDADAEFELLRAKKKYYAQLLQYEIEDAKLRVSPIVTVPPQDDLDPASVEQDDDKLDQDHQEPVKQDSGKESK